MHGVTEATAIYFDRNYKLLQWKIEWVQGQTKPWMGDIRSWQIKEQMPFSSNNST